MMTRKDYVLIANILRKQLDDSKAIDSKYKDHLGTVIIDICEDLIPHLLKDNPSFNPDTFRKAIFN